MQEYEQLDVARQRQHRPRGLRQHSGCNAVRVEDERVAGGHALGAHALDAAEQLLMLDLFVAEPHHRFQRVLIAQPVVAAHLEHLRRDKAFDQAEDVGVRTALNLTELSLLVSREEVETIDLRQTVGQELLGEIERAPAYHISIDVPTNALGDRDGLGVTIGVVDMLNGLRLHFAFSCHLRWTEHDMCD